MSDQAVYELRHQRIQLSDRVVHLSQMYPIYAAEAEVIRTIGLNTFFFDRDVDFYDLRRPMVTG